MAALSAAAGNSEEEASLLAQLPTKMPSNELCGICYTSELREEPCVRLACKHVFHANCVAQLLKHRHATLKITFGYLDCP